MEAPLTVEALSWADEGVTLAAVDAALARLRVEVAADRPSMRTSVMTHIAWVPADWEERAVAALEGMGERHPSRTILLFPDPDSGLDRIDGAAALESYEVPGSDRRVVSEVVSLRLHGTRAKAPASIVQPLLITDLPVFLRWRGEPPWGAQELEQLLGVTDRLVVDSTEWDDLPFPYRRLAELFERTVASDIAWERTSRWRSLLASLWPEIADVRAIRVHGTPAQGWLLTGWLRSRLDRDDIRLELVEADRLEGIDLDGEAAPFPPGDPPKPSDVLSEELDRYTREPVYEAAVKAATS